jgi:very-short-patch-repair endonuclease
MTSYNKLSDKEKKEILISNYVDQKLSFAEIADTYGTYSNRIRRDAIKYSIPIRNKSEAQKEALTTGRHKHPTKGTKRNEETKNKIGKKVLESWENLSDQELDKRKQKAKDNWNKLSEDEKQNILSSANAAVRNSSKFGSKLETYILKNLLKDGYKVDFHKEHILANTKLQIDLFIPTMSIAIEIDGPSHFEPVWGEDVLEKNKKYDKKKNGLILGKGLKLIRVQQKKDFSRTRADRVYERLIKTLKLIENKSINTQYIEIGD